MYHQYSSPTKNCILFCILFLCIIFFKVFFMIIITFFSLSPSLFLFVPNKMYYIWHLFARWWMNKRVTRAHIYNRAIRAWDSCVLTYPYADTHTHMHKISGAIFWKGFVEFLVKIFSRFFFIFGLVVLFWVSRFCICIRVWLHAHGENKREKSQRDREITPASPAVCRLNHSAHRQSLNMHTDTHSQILHTIHE